MESQPQNPEFRINPENFHPCICLAFIANLFTPFLDILLSRSVQSQMHAGAISKLLLYYMILRLYRL